MVIDCPIKCTWFDIRCSWRATESTLLYLGWMVFPKRTLFKIVVSSRCIFHRNIRMLRIAFSTPRIACLLRILQPKLLTLNTSWMLLNKPSYLDFVVEHFSSSEPRKNWQRFMGNCFPTAAPQCACHCSENYAGLFAQREKTI